MRTSSGLSGKARGRRSAALPAAPPLSEGVKQGSERARDAACLGVLAALTGAFFWRALFTGAVLLPADILLRLQPWRLYSYHQFPEFRRIYNPLLDAVLLFFPWRVFAARSIRAGEIPLWNPDSFCGQPFLANVSSAVLYPLNALFYVIDPARAYGYVVALHIFLAGAFTFLFLRVLGLRRPAALLGGIGFMFCGFLIVWAEYQTPVAATVWLPLALYFWERYARGQGRRYALYAALPLGMSLLGGHLQYAVYVLLAFGAYALWRSRLDWRSLVAAFAAGAIGLALAAHQILPSLELGRYNHRAGGQSLEGVLSAAMPAKQLITLLVPNFFGNSVDYNYWGHINFVEFCGYLGLLPLLLAAAGLWLRRDRQTWFFALLAVITLLMVLGTPLYAPFYYLVPGFKQLSNPARLLGVFSFAVACLGALGADAVLGLPPERRRGLAYFTGGFFLAALTAVALVYLLCAGEMASYGVAPYVERAILLFLATALVIVAAVVGTAGRGRAAYLLPALAAADLFLFGMRFNPAQDPAMLYFETESLRLLRQEIRDARMIALPAPGDDFMNAMIPNCNLVVGLPEVQGGDAMYPRRYREFVEFVETRHQGKPVSTGNGLRFSSIDTPGLDFLNAGYVLSGTELKSERLEHLGSPDAHLYRNRFARPRAFLVHQARVEPTERVLDAMAEEGFGLDRVALLEEEPGIALTPAAGPESARIVESRNGRVRIEVEATGGALLILADQFYPGWRATVDGEPAPLLAANYVLRAVPVPAGRHTVTMTYRPATFLFGLYLSLAAASLLLAVATATALQTRAR